MKHTLALATRAQSQEEEKTLSIALLKSEIKQAQLVPGPDEYDTSNTRSNAGNHGNICLENGRRKKNKEH